MSGEDDKKLSKKKQRMLENASKNQKSLLADKKFWYSMVALVMLCGAGFMQFIFLVGDFMKGGPGGGVQFMDVNDQEQAKKVFFSGQPHVVYCVSDKTEMNPVPTVITDIAEQLRKTKDTDTTQVLAANCFKKMPTGRTIAERFNFGKNEGFIGIFANQEKPLQLNYLPNAKNVAKQIKTFVKPTIQKVTYLKDIKKCQGRRSCMILGAKKADVLNRSQALFRPSLTTYRGVSVSAVDTSFWKVQLDEEFVKTRPEEDEQFGSAICIVKEKKNEDADGVQLDKKQETVWRAAWLESWADPLDFMSLCEKGGDPDWFQLTKQVDVKARSSKPKVINPDGLSDKDATKAAFREKQAERDGTKQGAKEKVGRLAEEVEEEIDDADFGDGEEEEVEDVEL